MYLTIFSFFIFIFTANSDTDENNAKTPKTFPYTEKWKETFDWVHSSALGEQYTYCRVCHRNLGTFLRGTIDLNRHSQTNLHKKKVALAINGNSQNGTSKPLPCSHAAVQFIHQYFNHSGKKESTEFARCKLGLHYPKDITSDCQHTPYCLYVYGGVTVEPDTKVSVVLVGYFDTEAPKHCIKFLDALEYSADSLEDHKADAVVGILKKFDMPTANLVAVYLDGMGVASKQMHTQLKDVSPTPVSLDGLYSIADEACAAAVKELSNQVLEMLVDIHAHHTSCSTKNDKLSALFGSEEDDSASFYDMISTRCLKLYQLVTRLLEMWPDLKSYFDECSTGDEKAKLICSQLQDPKVRGKYMILSEAIKPLHNFQTNLQPQKEASRADLVVIFKEASNLLQTYTSCFLNPQAALRFLKERETQILTNTNYHLSSTKMCLGGPALQAFLKESECSDILKLLQEEALPLYIALTSSIAEALPLSDGMLKSIAQLLNPQSSLKVTVKAIEDLGAKLGACPTPEEANLLTGEFSEYQLAAKGQTEKEDKDNSEVSLEKHWAKVLKDTKPTSIFRKLILTLLALPCPPLDSQQIFNKV